MAQHAILEIPANVWTQITANDITTITVIHRGGAECLIQPTVGANAPTSTDRRGLPLAAGRMGFVDGFLKELLTDLAITAGVNRVYAYSMGGPCVLYVQTD